MTSLATPVNEVQSTIATGNSYTRGTSTTIVLTDGTNFPNSAQVIRISSGSKWCLVIYTSKSTHTLTMGGGATDYALAKNVTVGDEAYEFPAGSKVEVVCSADHFAQTVRTDGSIPLTSDWDAGAHGIRALNLTADGLTSGRVVFAGANGLLLDDAGMLWDNSSKALTVQKEGNLQVTFKIASATSWHRADLAFARSRGTLGSATIVESGDTLGIIRGQGYDGTGFFSAAEIVFAVDGVAAEGDMPGRIEFKTRDSGGSGTASRMVIKENGNVGIATASFGTSAAKVLALGAGTAPTTSPANVSQLWSAAVNAAAGHAWLHGRDEKGHTLIVAGVVLKTDTGHPADPHEGLIEINTNDNKAYIYGDADWREIATWA